MRRGGWLLTTTAALSLLGACSPDYSAVRDWSVQARDAVLPLETPRVSAGPAVAPAPPATVAAEGRLGAVLALQEAAAAWLSVLAYIADDGLPRVRDNPLAGLVPKVQPFDAQGAGAVSNLGETIAYAAHRNWRAPYLAYAVDRGDADFQAVIAALRRQSAALAAEAPPAAESARQQGAATARAQAIERVATGHALLMERRQILSQSETARLLRLQESELRRLMLLGLGG
jgi:hypothetical protein